MRLDMDKTLQDQDNKLYGVIDLLTPGFNHTHKALIKPEHRSAKDLTAQEIVNNATPEQLEFMRKRGLIG